MEGPSENKVVLEAVTTAADEAKQESPAVIYIDPAKEKAIMRKFDLFAMPQFVILVILGRSGNY